MSMSSKLKQTLIAMSAAATLLIATPSQAGQRYCPNPHDHGHGHGYGYGHVPPPPRWSGRDHAHRGHDPHAGWHGHDHGWRDRRDYRQIAGHGPRRDMRHDPRHDRREDWRGRRDLRRGD